MKLIPKTTCNGARATRTAATFMETLVYFSSDHLQWFQCSSYCRGGLLQPVALLEASQLHGVRHHSCWLCPAAACGCGDVYEGGACVGGAQLWGPAVLVGLRGFVRSCGGGGRLVRSCG
eukprot:scaffold155289_cov17-Tisochrysis_lutea.AAC.2